MKSLLLLFCFTVFIFACKKDKVPVAPTEEYPNPDPDPDSDPNPTVVFDTVFVYNNTYDTIYPSNYLMAYPGSWWKYDDASEVKCTGWDQVNHLSKSITGTTITLTTDTHILPRLSNLGYISNRHVVYSYPNYTPTGFKKIIGESLGEVLYFWQTMAGSGNYVVTKTQEIRYVNHLSELIVGGQIFSDVMVITDNFKWVYQHTGSGPAIHTTNYYAKNVGLIKCVVRSYGLGVSSTKEITSYFIAPH